MSLFTLDDIYNLVVSNKKKSNMGEYSLSDYQIFITENIQIIEDLIKNVQESVDKIKDDKIKKRVLNWLKELLKTYEENKVANPEKDYKNSPYSNDNSRVGYFITHPHAAFIEQDYQKRVLGYSKIINFMNNIYQYYKICAKKGEFDSITLWNIFDDTKKSCSKLGIHCPNADYIYDFIISDPYMEKSSKLLEFEFDIDEENSLPEDIMITSIPYTVTCPYFRFDGPQKYEMPINTPKPKIWYNKSFLKKGPIR